MASQLGIRDRSQLWGSSDTESLRGPEESKEPIAIEALERGEYSSEPLRDEEYGEGGKSREEGRASL